MELTIIKREGGAEAWSDDKLITSVMKAGANGQEAQQVLTQVKNWSEDNAKNGKIKTDEIRDKTIEELDKVNPVASETYRIYKKSS